MEEITAAVTIVTRRMQNTGGFRLSAEETDECEGSAPCPAYLPGRRDLPPRSGPRQDLGLGGAKWELSNLQPYGANRPGGLLTASRVQRTARFLGYEWRRSLGEPSINNAVATIRIEPTMIKVDSAPIWSTANPMGNAPRGMRPNVIMFKLITLARNSSAVASIASD